jgi:hypothetical protein
LVLLLGIWWWTGGYKTNCNNEYQIKISSFYIAFAIR